jgi:hypothetical protein
VAAIAAAASEAAAGGAEGEGAEGEGGGTPDWREAKSEDMVRAGAAAGQHRLTLFLTYQPCHFSGGHVKNIGKAVGVGLGRIVALYHRAFTLHQIRQHIRCLYF